MRFGHVWVPRSRAEALEWRRAVVAMHGPRRSGSKTNDQQLLIGLASQCQFGPGAELPAVDGLTPSRDPPSNRHSTRPRVGKPGGQRVGERVGDVFYPTWRAGSKFWRLAQNKADYAVLAVQASFHFAWHSSISAAPKILVFGNFAEFR